MAYKINDWLLVSGGLRYVIAKNKTEGHVTDIELKLPSGWARADAIMKQIADGSAASAAVATAFIGYGLGSLTFDQVPTDYISSADRTKLELTDSTRKDMLLGYEVDGTPVTMFPNGAKTRNDMPAMLAIGVDYRISGSLKLSLGSNYFFDRTADYGHKIDADLNSATPIIHIENKDIIDRNGFSLQAGLEYNISEKLLVSGGYVWANKGVNAKNQSDITYGLASQTFGLGGAYNFNKKIQINIVGGYIMYKDDSKVYDHIYSRTRANMTANETYRKRTVMFAVGVDFRF